MLFMVKREMPDSKPSLEDLRIDDLKTWEQRELRLNEGYYSEGRRLNFVKVQKAFEEYLLSRYHNALSHCLKNFVS